MLRNLPNSVLCKRLCLMHYTTIQAQEYVVLYNILYFTSTIQACCSAAYERLCQIQRPWLRGDSTPRTL